jgi:hypothetical protein
MSPFAPPTPCRTAGCALTQPCPRHPGYKTVYGGGDPHNTYRWQTVRRAYIQRNPWCVPCANQGKQTKATQVDHIDTNPAMFWFESNYMAMCHSCHSRKTVAVDGGFGR